MRVGTRAGGNSEKRVGKKNRSGGTQGHACRASSCMRHLTCDVRCDFFCKKKERDMPSSGMRALDDVIQQGLDCRIQHLRGRAGAGAAAAGAAAGPRRRGGGSGCCVAAAVVEAAAAARAGLQRLQQLAVLQAAAAAAAVCGGRCQSRT